jgi:hypothetical protein
MPSIHARRSSMNRFVTLSAVLSMGLASSIALAQEKHVRRRDLPSAVGVTADRESIGSTVKGYVKEREHGRTVYEVETVVGGRTRDIEIEVDGTVSEIEQEIAFASLPDEVKHSLMTEASGAKITKVESLTKEGKLVAYEAALLRGAHKSELQVGPAGEHLSQEE